VADGYHDRFDGILDDDTIDELIDLRLRREFARAFPAAGGDPVGELRALTPAMRRARAVHRVRSGAIGLAAALVLVAGVGAAVSRLPALDDQSVAANGSLDADPDDGDLPEADGAALEVTGTSSLDQTEVRPADEQARTPETDPTGSTATGSGPAGVEGDGGTVTGDPGATAGPGPAPTSTTTITGSTAAQGTGGTSPPPPSQPATTPTSSGTTSTARPTTTTTKPTTSTTSPPSTTESGDQVVSSNCGSITVSVTGIYVFLETISPLPGYRADTKSNGPYKVEVGLAGGEHGEEHHESSSSECQITAQVVSGELRTKVEQ